MATLQAQFAGANPPEAAVLLRRIYRLRDYVSEPSVVERWLTQVTQNARAHPLVRDEALNHLALIKVKTDDLAAAEAQWRALGYVRQWGIVGPFAIPAEGLDAILGPEHGFVPGESFSDASGKQRHWRNVVLAQSEAWLDLADFYSQPGAAIAFAESSLYAEADRRVALRFGADSAVTLFVNGVKVFCGRDEVGMDFDQHVVAVNLRAGWNSMVLKLQRSSGEGSWRFALRVSELQGGGLAWRASPVQPAKNLSLDETASDGAPAQDLVQMALDAAEADRRSPSRLETLGLMEHEHARGAAFDHLEAAARMAGTSDRWLAVASACSEASCRFAALNAALHVEPQNVAARIALADYYFGRRQKEKARDLLRQAVRLAPGNFLARKRLADLYVSVGMNALALAEYEKLEQEFPGPLWLKRQLASRYDDLGMHERAEVLLRSALRANFDGVQERSLLLRILERRRDRAGLQAAYSEMARLRPTDVQPLIHLAELASAAEDFAAAEKTLRKALEIDDHSSELHGQLADALAASGRGNASRAELVRALELNPHLRNVRQRLQDSAATVIADESEYLTDAHALAAAAQRHPPEEPANAVMLGDVRVERVYENGLSSARVQQLYYIATEQGARDFHTRSIQYSPGSQELHILRARVHKPDGRVLEADESGETGSADAGVAMYYDVRSRSLSFPVERGDVIELDYRTTPNSNINPYGDYFGNLVVFGSQAPEKMKRYVLITPERRKFNVYEARMPAPAGVAVRGKERVYRWDAENLPPLSGEPRGPAVTEVAPYVHVSTFASWDEIGRWYAQLIRPQFALDSRLREALSRIVAGKKTDIEKVNAIHQFVLRSTHYVALEFGIYSYKPYPVSQVYARRFGDCKDKASLMIALLRAAGVEAEIALVRTRRLGEVGERATSISVFNHAVVYVPAYDLWLDGTAEYAGSHELPLEDQGAMALTVSAAGHAQLRQIPVTSPADNYTRRTVVAKIQSDGGMQFSGSAYTRGEDAPGLRREYEVAERQREAVRNTLAEIFPSVHVEDVSVQAEDLEHDVMVNFRGALDTFKGKGTLSLPASWMPRSYVQKLAPLATRTQDLLLPAPWTTEEELHFVLPSGGGANFVPQDKNLHTQFGSASLKYERRGRELVVRTSVQFRKLRIRPDEYPAFRDFCGQVERAFREEIKVRLGV